MVNIWTKGEGGSKIEFCSRYSKKTPKSKMTAIDHFFRSSKAAIPLHGFSNQKIHENWMKLTPNTTKIGQNLLELHVVAI